MRKQHNLLDLYVREKTLAFYLFDIAHEIRNEQYEASNELFDKGEVHRDAADELEKQYLKEHPQDDFNFLCSISVECIDDWEIYHSRELEDKWRAKGYHKGCEGQPEGFNLYKVDKRHLETIKAQLMEFTEHLKLKNGEPDLTVTDEIEYSSIMDREDVKAYVEQYGIEIENPYEKEMNPRFPKVEVTIGEANTQITNHGKLIAHWDRRDIMDAPSAAFEMANAIKMAFENPVELVKKYPKMF